MGTQGLGREGTNYTQNEIDHARNWLRQGAIDLWRLQRNPEQHHRQANIGTAGSSVTPDESSPFDKLRVRILS
jgi:hypothetical protein